MSTTAAFALTDQPGSMTDAAAARVVRNAIAALDALHGLDVSALSDTGLLVFEARLEQAGRMIDAAHVSVAGETATRSDRAFGNAGLAARHGCATPAQLIERVTGVSARTARQRIRVSARATTRTSDTGGPLPALFPHVGDALRAGALGIDSADAITTTLATIDGDVSAAALSVAESTLVQNATGTAAVPPVSADLIRQQAALYRDRLDPDGLEPRDERLIARRDLSFLEQADGGVKPVGYLPPAQWAIIRPVFDAFTSPRTASACSPGAEPGTDISDDAAAGTESGADDRRTAGQKRADALVAMVQGAVNTGQTPKLHSAPAVVTIVVDKRGDAADPAPGITPGTSASLPPLVVAQTACDASIHHIVFGDDGDVVDLTTKDRFFTALQRKAMIARDGPTCAAPGCSIPAYCCEAHHIIPWQHHGPTSVANGVLLCWFHHRLLDRGEWTVVMQHGRPVFTAPTWYAKRPYFAPRRQ
jgi:DNA-binding transcriptional regulator YdaS (Cro superfamily)